MPRVLVLLCLLLALAAAGCGGDDDSEPAAPTAETTAEEPQTRSGCQQVDEPQAREQPDLSAPKTRLSANRTHTVELITSCGEIEIELDVERAPKTTSSFASLVRRKFYDGLIFHRLNPEFVVQGGDPLGTGTGGPGYSVREAPPEDLVYGRGVVAMAKTQIEPAGTSGSQFFIVLAEDTGLPPEYALVGKVTEASEETLNKIAALQVEPGGERPAEPVVIQQARLKSS